jgi:hypothetical protein
MRTYTNGELELLNTALDEYVRRIYINILDYKLGEHYCYLERSLMERKLIKLLDKTLKKQEEYMKSLKQV